MQIVEHDGIGANQLSMEVTPTGGNGDIHIVTRVGKRNGIPPRIRVSGRKKRGIRTPPVLRDSKIARGNNRQNAVAEKIAIGNNRARLVRAKNSRPGVEKALAFSKKN